MTKYVITIVNKTDGTTHALVTRHTEKISEVEDALDDDEIMFVNEYEYENRRPENQSKG